MKTKITSNTYTFHADPSHGWLRVPFAMVYLLGIGDSISKYSYMSDNGKTFYLEEDCDAGRFFLAYRELFKNDPIMKLKTCNGRSTIRNKGTANWPLAIERFMERGNV